VVTSVTERGVFFVSSRKVTFSLAIMLMKLFTMLENWVVPGENVTNPGDKENHNPMDDLNVDPHAWGGRV
jgi:hypothetical protein